MRTLTQWSVADYQRMRKLGILDHRCCELINGEIWDVTPERELHRFFSDRDAGYLRQILQNKAVVFEGHPVTLAKSEPEPDIAIVLRPDTRYLQHHPYLEDIYWLVEVADTTLTFDLDVKRKLYAEAGIAEYWVVNVVGKRMHVFRDLRDGDYSTQNVVSDGIVCPVAFPDISIEVRQLVSIPE